MGKKKKKDKKKKKGKRKGSGCDGGPDNISLSEPMSISTCYEEWDEEMYTGPRLCDLLLMQIAIQYDHSRAFDKYQSLTLHDLLAADFLRMWRYPNKAIMTMRMSTMISTLKGLEWAALSTVNPVMRTPEWIAAAKELLEALRSRFYYFISHAPLSSRVLDAEEDYTEEYQQKIDLDEEHDPEKLDRDLGLEEEDYEPDSLVAYQLQRKKQLSAREIDWSAMGMVEDQEENEKEEEQPLQWDKDGVLIIKDESVEVGTAKKAIPMMTTMEFIHDIGWSFFILDEAFALLDKPGRIVVPDTSLTKMRRHLAAKARTSWDSIAVARKDWQYRIQCTDSATAKHKRRSQQNECTPTEVLSSTMMAVIDTIEMLPADHQEMFKRKIWPLEKENSSYLTKHLTANYWSQRTQELNSGWIRLNTDFLFQTIGGMEIEKGSAVDYVLSTGKIQRLAITGKWVLYHRKKEYLCDSMTGAYLHMRKLQRERGDDAQVIDFCGDFDLEMPATIQLDQFDHWLF